MERAFGSTLIAAILLIGGPALRTADPPADDEQQVGESVFKELKARAEIISTSPLYDVLRPVAAPIMKAAEPRYGRPFAVYLVHEPGPNAFSVPGGNVYVTDELLYFVRNSDELAGTLCHEVAHTIGHDAMNKMREEQQMERRGAGAAILLGPRAWRALAVGLIGASLAYSREVEGAADLAGADLCAASGQNPWGLVWLLQDFEKTDTARVPQLLSDHPDNAHRVAALRSHFREKPTTFAGFPADQAQAKPFATPKAAPVVFLR